MSKMDPCKVKIPPMRDLTIENITENTILINSQGPDPRLQYILERLVTHLHDFARETRLSTKEWMAGLQFLIEVGKICSDVRNVSKLIRTLFLSPTTRRSLSSLSEKGPDTKREKEKGNTVPEAILPYIAK